MTKSGKAWVFGDNIDTDILAPGLYMKGPLKQLADHCLEAVDPQFAGNVNPGDVIVGGENFGIGSSREQAVQALQFLGVRTLVAKSFAGIFFRNALNSGVVALTCKSAGNIRMGDEISADAANGVITNHTTDETYPCDRLPDNLLEIVRDGGLVKHLEKRLATGDAVI
ncbi:MAG: 3-isopropylmalate dehydratase [Hyphomicrobiales bacterium]|nr:3-isopropylmalate dehydratase [Hyphomicrobiales bacterium]